MDKNAIKRAVVWAPRPANVRTFDIEGQPVRCIEPGDGNRTWVCECPDFQDRAERYPEGFCAHTALAIWQCLGEMVDMFVELPDPAVGGYRFRDPNHGPRRQRLFTK